MYTSYCITNQMQKCLQDRQQNIPKSICCWKSEKSQMNVSLKFFRLPSVSPAIPLSCRCHPHPSPLSALLWCFSTATGNIASTDRQSCSIISNSQVDVIQLCCFVYILCLEWPCWVKILSRLSLPARQANRFETTFGIVIVLEKRYKG